MFDNKRENNFPKWYQEVLNKAELSDSGPVRGTIVIRPYAYAIWELMQHEMDLRIKRAGAENAYFPLFIPDSYLKKEARHVEGFSPELAVVTHAGGVELEEAIVVRPTSETIIGEFMGKWIQSYRNLPLLLNQWANVVRWEKRPRAFLRTTEFLWQEGHTAHCSREDAADYARLILNDVYEDFFRDTLAVPIIKGIKPESERFAGAINTMTCEAMTGDGRALQMATSHELGTNFAEAFEIQFTNREGILEYAWTTSWGSSTRMMGGLFMVHGDNRGLRLPPKVAPYQVVIVQVNETPGVSRTVKDIEQSLLAENIRVKIDNDFTRSFGARVTDWEIKGVPIRIDIGDAEVLSGTVSLLRRDSLTKMGVGISSAAGSIIKLLESIQKDMLRSAEEYRDAHTVDLFDLKDVDEHTKKGFVRVPAEVALSNEDRLRELTLSIRCINNENGDLPTTSEESFAIISRSY